MNPLPRKSTQKSGRKTSNVPKVEWKIVGSGQWPFQAFVFELDGGQ